MKATGSRPYALLDAFFAKTQRPSRDQISYATLPRNDSGDTSRKSPFSLYRKEIASFDTGNYKHSDAEGFINRLGLPAAVRSRSSSNHYEALARSV